MSGVERIWRIASTDNSKVSIASAIRAPGRDFQVAASLANAAPDCLRAPIGQLCGAHVVGMTANQSRLAHDPSEAAARRRPVVLATGLAAASLPRCDISF